ncbi:MAG: Ig-like domain-containing protein [Planctomycetota bacterium]|nr:Ig-like domain-containing protein [Planctomycetota bacterium]
MRALWPPKVHIFIPGLLALCAVSASHAETLDVFNVSDAPDPLPQGGVSFVKASVRYPAVLKDHDTRNLTRTNVVVVRLRVTTSLGAVVADRYEVFSADRQGRPGLKTEDLVFTWDGRNETGQLMPPGRYNYEVQAQLQQIIEIRVFRTRVTLVIPVLTSSPERGSITLVSADAAPPLITPLTPTPGSLIAAPRPAISASFSDPGSGVDPASATLSLDGVGRPITANAAGFSYTPASNLAQGTHQVEVQVSDFAGNRATSNWTFFIDSAGPQITALLPANGSTTSNPRPAMSASFSDPAPGSGVAPLRTEILLDGANVTGGAVVTAAGFGYAPAADLAEGTHALQVTVEDAAGNRSTAASVFTVDRTPPSLGGFTPSPGSLVRLPTPALSASWTDAGSGMAPATAALRLDGNLVAAQAGPTGIQHAPLSALSEGAHTVALSVADQAGNVATANWSFRVDTQAPQITNLLPASGGCTNDARPTFSGLLRDPAPGTGIAAVRLLLDGVDVSGQALIQPDLFIFQPPANLPDGAHTLRVEATDAAGNTGAAMTSVEIDTTPPPAPVIDQVVRTIDRVTVSGDSPADVVAILATADGAVVESAIIASFTVVFAKDQAEQFDFTLRFQDCAGNIGPALEASEFFLSTNEPLRILNAGILAPPGGKKVERDGVTYLNTGEALVRFAISGGAPPYTADVDGVTAAPTGAVGGIFEATLGGLDEGPRTLTVNARDAAGATASLPLELVVDRTPPVLTLTSHRKTFPLDYLITNVGGRTLPVTGTVLDSGGSGPARVVVQIYNDANDLLSQTLPLDPALDPGAFATTVDIGVQERFFPVLVQAFDDLGNASLETFEVRLDNQAPGVDPWNPNSTQGIQSVNGFSDGWFQIDPSVWDDPDSFVDPSFSNVLALYPDLERMQRFVLARRGQTTLPACFSVPLRDLAGNTGELLIHFPGLPEESYLTQAISPLVFAFSGGDRRVQAQFAVEQELRDRVLPEAASTLLLNATGDALFDLTVPFSASLDNTHEFLTRGQVVFVDGFGNPDPSDVHDLELLDLKVDGQSMVNDTRWIGPPAEGFHTLTLTARVEIDGQPVNASVEQQILIPALGPGPALENGVVTYSRFSRVSPNAVAQPRTDEAERLVEVYIAPPVGAESFYRPTIDNAEVVAYDALTGNATVRLLPTSAPDDPVHQDGTTPGLLPVNGSPQMLNVMRVRPSALQPGTTTLLTVTGGDLQDPPGGVRAFEYSSDEDLWNLLSVTNEAHRVVFTRAEGDEPAAGPDSGISVLRMRIRKDPRLYSAVADLDIELRVGADVPPGLYDLTVPLVNGESATLPKVLRVP